MKKTLLTLFALGLLGCAGPAPEPEAAAAPGRPAITAIANFVIKTDSIDDARTFYGKYLGYAEAFTHARPGVAGDIAVFKINDRQFIEVSPTLANEEDDKMIQIGFETADAQQLRNYLAAKGVAVPATVDAQTAMAGGGQPLGAGSPGLTGLAEAVKEQHLGGFTAAFAHQTRAVRHRKSLRLAGGG